MADEKIEQKSEIIEKPIKNGSKSEIYQEKLGGKFKKGNPGGGKHKGIKSFNTLFNEAIRIIVREKRIPGLANPEIDLVIKAVIEGLKGNYPYFRDIMDRRFGKPKESIELEIKPKMVQLDD